MTNERLRRAIVCSRLDGPAAVELQQLPRRAPEPGQVGVELAACGLNFPDVLMTRGGYQLKPELPFTPGMEAAGTIVALGAGVTDRALGDRVSVAMRFGLMTDYINAPEAMTVPAPRSFSMEEAACYWAALHTARHALVDRAQVQPGERVLVLGAAGGVGYASVQLAVHIGAEVMAAASSDEKLAAARAAGAPHLINYQQSPLVDAVRAHWPDGVDVIVDPVGGDLFEAALRLPRWGGRLLVVGFASGRIGNAPANLPLIKGYSILGVRAGEATRRKPELGEQSRAALKDWTDAGLMRPLIGARFALEQAASALTLMDERGAIGRIVLTTGN